MNKLIPLAAAALLALSLAACSSEDASTSPIAVSTPTPEPGTYDLAATGALNEVYMDAVKVLKKLEKEKPNQASAGLTDLSKFGISEDKDYVLNWVIGDKGDPVELELKKEDVGVILLKGTAAEHETKRFVKTASATKDLEVRLKPLVAALKAWRGEGPPVVSEGDKPGSVTFTESAMEYGTDEAEPVDVGHFPGLELGLWSLTNDVGQVEGYYEPTEEYFTLASDGTFSKTMKLFTME